MNDYPRVTHAFYNSPWAILPEKLAEMDAFIRQKVRGDSVPSPTPSASTRPEFQANGKTALIPIFGVLAQRMNLFQAISGGTSTEMIGWQFDAAMADKTIRSIVLVVDSPGGSVFGVEELARKIFGARGEKKVVAIADSMAASAAYWIATQAQELIVTPGGQVGSVGVVAAHQDWSKAEELAGVKTTLVHAGRYKTEGNPSSPLSAEGHEYLQGMVNSYYDMFLKAVARGRGVSEGKVEKEFGQGRMRVAKDALEAGMADRIATREQVLNRLGAVEPMSVSAATAGYIARAAEVGIDH